MMATVGMLGPYMADGKTRSGARSTIATCHHPRLGMGSRPLLNVELCYTEIERVSS